MRFNIIKKDKAISPKPSHASAQANALAAAITKSARTGKRVKI